MSLKYICEVVVYLQSFKNIDLEQQGVYLLKSHIKSRGAHVLPHRHFESKAELHSRKRNKIKSEATILDHQYKSKSFLVKFNDQEIDLEQVVVFRVQIESYPHNQEQIYLILDLYYDKNIEEGVNDNTETGFQRIDSLRLRLNGVEKGICCFDNLVFSDDYKSSARVYVFSMMMDVKFRTWKMLQKTKEVEREAMCTIKQYYQYFLKNSKQGESGFYKKYIKYLRECCEQAKTNIAGATSNMGREFRLPRYCIDDRTPTMQMVETNHKTMVEYINVFKIEEYSVKQFQEQILLVSAQNYLFFQRFLKHLEQGDLDKDLLIQKHNDFNQNRYRQFTINSSITQKDLSLQKHSHKQKISTASKFRGRKHYFQNLESYGIERVSTDLASHPIVFNEVTLLNPQPQKEYEVKNVLFVFCHGFQGSSRDVFSIKNDLKQMYPKASFLLARSNEGHTTGDIWGMGQRLAAQIQEFIEGQMIGLGLLIHMIGHSLGGIILRASLRHLTKYKNRLGTFVSLSSPHLSYMNKTKKSIETGLWLIKKWKDIPAIEQMTMSDSKNIEETFMFKLSKIGSLSDFNRVVLVSSPQDSYVPWHSARIHESSKDVSHSTSLEALMVDNIFAGSKIHKVHRVSVDFHIPQKSLDSVIGRTAHIRFLSDQNIVQMMLNCIPDMFN